MQVKKIAVLAAALLLCSCGEAGNSDVLSEAALTSTGTSATEIIDETTAREIYAARLSPFPPPRQAAQRKSL